ncbi:MAG: BsuPI domain-containing protein [Bacteroidetes bacterium]|nr:BsuPI domain-containing protein [Bacteroidota bacterium]
MKTFTLSILLASATLSACSLFTDSPDENSSLNSTITTDGMAFTLSVPTTSFAQSDTLKLTFQVSNNSNVAKEFNFSNVQQLGFRLTDWFGRTALSHPNIVSPALSAFVLQPGESNVLSISRLFRDYNGQSVARGSYRLSAYLLDGNSPPVSLQISVN